MKEADFIAWSPKKTQGRKRPEREKNMGGVGRGGQKGNKAYMNFSN